MKSKNPKNQKFKKNCKFPVLFHVNNPFHISFKIYSRLEIFGAQYCGEKQDGLRWVLLKRKSWVVIFIKKKNVF